MKMLVMDVMDAKHSGMAISLIKRYTLIQDIRMDMMGMGILLILLMVPASLM